MTQKEFMMKVSQIGAMLAENGYEKEYCLEFMKNAVIGQGYKAWIEGGELCVDFNR